MLECIRTASVCLFVPQTRSCCRFETAWSVTWRRCATACRSRRTRWTSSTTPSPTLRPTSSGWRRRSVGHSDRRTDGSVSFSDALDTFYLRLYGRKEGNVLFNDGLNIFYLRLYGKKEMFYLTKEGKKCFI